MNLLDCRGWLLGVVGWVGDDHMRYSACLGLPTSCSY